MARSSLEPPRQALHGAPDRRFDHRARASHRMALIAADGQQTRLHGAAPGTCRWPTGRGSVRLAGADDDGWQAGGAAIEIALARVIVHEEFADGDGTSHQVVLWVSLVRSVFGFCIASPPKHAILLAKTARGTSSSGADGLEDVNAAIKIDAQDVVETFLALAAHHRCEMKKGRRGIGADGGEDRVAIADILPRFAARIDGSAGDGRQRRQPRFSPDRFRSTDGPVRTPRSSSFLGRAARPGARRRR